MENKMIINNLNEIVSGGKSTQEIYTTLEDKKAIFNLETKCDYKINDCKGETLRIKDVLIKKITSKLSEPITNEETGEIIKEYETKIITILIDDAGKSYVTASKSFGIQLIRLIGLLGDIEEIKNGIEIKISERSVKNSPNKALCFELI